MAWQKYTEKAPEIDGVFACKMKDGSDKHLIFYMEYDYNELEMEGFYWYHWFESEQDKKDWIPLPEEEEPDYWYNNN